MTDLFLKLVNMSITASYLVGAVILLRLLLRKAPKALHCALWALVAFRLVCPFSLESAFSLVPEREEITLNTIRAESADSAPRAEKPVSTRHPETAATIAASDDVTPEYDFEPPVTGTILLNLTAIWFAGMGLMLLYAVESYWRIHRKAAPSICIGSNVWICDHIDSPFVLGLIKPRIYLPSALKSGDADYVLAHERAHLKRKDHWWKPLGFLLLSVYWFNPVLWIAYILLCRDIEMACDEEVVRDMDVPEKKAYSTALLNCSLPRHMIAACPLAFGEVGVKERVKKVLHYKKPALWIILIAVIVCILAAACLLTDPKDADTWDTSALTGIAELSEDSQDRETIRLSAAMETLNWGTVPDGLLRSDATFFDPQYYGDCLYLGCDNGGTYRLLRFRQNENGQYEYESIHHFNANDLDRDGETILSTANLSDGSSDLRVLLIDDEDITGIGCNSGTWRYIRITRWPSIVVLDKSWWGEMDDYYYYIRRDIPPCMEYSTDENGMPVFGETVAFDAKSNYMFNANVTFYGGVNRPGTFTPEDTELQKLAEILADIPAEAIEYCQTKRDTDLYVNLMVYLHSGGRYDEAESTLSFHLMEEDVFLTVYTTTGGDLYQNPTHYSIDNAELEEFLASLCDNSRRSSNVIVTLSYEVPVICSHGDITIQIKPLLNWEYEVVKYTNDQTPFGIRGRPKGKTEGWIFFSWQPDIAKLSGPIQVESEKGGANEDNTQWRLPYCKNYSEDAQEINDYEKMWSSITFPELSEHFAIVNDGADQWFADHYSEIVTTFGPDTFQSAS